jgi:uncharacterized protein
MSDWFTAWPFWVGGPVFGVLVVGYWKLVGFPIGTSGSLGRVTDVVSDRETARAQAAFEDPDELAAALRAATMEQFGADAVPPAGSTQAPVHALTSTGRPPLPWTAHLVFLLGMGVGGIVATSLRGNLKITTDMGTSHAAIFGTGISAALVLLGAGILIGFGTRMGGGCSSGHGLSGCSRLQPGSLIGTGAFFGAAVAISFLIERVL